MPRATDILPALYYYDHFNEMVDFVLRVYGDILGSDDIAFIEDFRALDRSSQCLFIRMCNRVKPLFHQNDLRYDEIEAADAIAELMARGYVRTISECDYDDLLSVMPKARLLEIAKACGLEEPRASWSKPKLAQHIRDSLCFEAMRGACGDTRFFVPVRKCAVQYLLYLYFGKASDSLTSFALRDLGLISVNRREEHTSRFESRHEARAGFFYTQAIKCLKTKRAGEFERLYSQLGEFPAAETEYVSALRTSVLHALGLYYERAKDMARAEEIYAGSDSFECRERLVRIWHAQKRTARVEDLLDAMMENPYSDEEHMFAADFYARKFGKQKTGMHTELLRAGRSISVDEYYRGSPEQAAARHFKKDGWSGYYLENLLWNSLFGIVFWEELFEHAASFSSDFDFSPQLLRSKRFHIQFAHQVEAKLARIRAGEAAEMIAQGFARHYGKPNGIFGWYEDLRAPLLRFAAAAPGEGVAQMLASMAADFYRMRDGYPDLMLIKGGTVKFVEVKAEGDQIRRNQLTRLTQLRKAGFEAEICRVEYHVDPDQVYVVVDIETTGGRPPYDRITEIAAVKVQNGAVIDEWQSLINPQRSIPSFITQLTGITNAMVCDAPVFRDIADELEAFMEGAIFVAHNVNFDYGFIASEYRALDREFRYPKLCTVASMRRHFPGHGSYSLHNICKEYGIPLTDHHRAMCDARAAAGLLMLVQARRLEGAAALAA